MLYYLIVLLIWAVPQRTSNLDVISELLPSVRPECLWVDTIPQAYFPELLFLRIDTGCYNSMNPRPSYRPMRIALDTTSQVYKLSNLDSMQYDEMATSYPVSGADLDVESIFEYGRFFIELTLNYSFYEYHYIESVNAFIELNRALMIDDRARSIKRQMEEFESQIRQISEELNFSWTIFDRSTRSYALDYYIWYQHSGDFRHIRLNIEQGGNCQVLVDSVLVHGVGYYDSATK